MITLVEGANRQRTPNEIALTILLAVLTIVFIPVVVTLQAFGHYSGSDGLGRHPRLPAGLPDPDHHRRAPLGHRHRRDGSPRAAQRPRHERARRGGGRRRADAPARQDGHHHAGQPDGVGLLPGAWTHRRGGGGRRPTGVAGRRDARGPLHRGSGQGALRHPRAGAVGFARVRPVLGHDQDVGTRHGRPPDPQGCRGVGAQLGRRAGGHAARRPPGDRRPHRPGRVHPAGCGGRPGHPRGDRAQGRRQDRDPGEVRRDARRWGSARS